MSTISLRVPQELSAQDWEEVRQNEAVIDSWGLAAEDTADALRESVYAAKFYFEPQTMPNYRGEVLLLVGDGLEPLVLIREQSGKLVATDRQPQGNQVHPNVQDTIFVTVMDRIAEVDPSTVPKGLNVEVIDINLLAQCPDAAKELSAAARAYAKVQGYI